MNVSMTKTLRKSILDELKSSHRQAIQAMRPSMQTLGGGFPEYFTVEKFTELAWRPFEHIPNIRELYPESHLYRENAYLYYSVKEAHLNIEALAPRAQVSVPMGPNFTSSSAYVELPEDDPLRAEIIDMKAAESLLNTKQLELEEAVEAVLEKATSLNKLLLAYPDLREFVPDKYMAQMQEEEKPKKPASTSTSTDANSKPAPAIDPAALMSALALKRLNSNP